jgi:ribose transport system permease protein
MTHLPDIVNEGADRLEEAAELGTLSKPLQVPLLGVPLDTDHILSRILAAARDLLIASSVVGIIACPATMLLIAGQFDLSVGGATALVTVMFATSFVDGNSLMVSVLIALGVGIGVGAVNGFLVTVVGINALITTIGTLGITRAFAFIHSDGASVGFNGFSTLGISRPFLNIPWMVWIFLAVVLITMLMMRFTTYGRSLYAIGANPVAARLVGIRTRRVVFLTFVLSGLAVGLTGLLLASQTGQGVG